MKIRRIRPTADGEARARDVHWQRAHTSQGHDHRRTGCPYRNGPKIDGVGRQDGQRSIRLRNEPDDLNYLRITHSVVSECQGARARHEARWNVG